MLIATIVDIDPAHIEAFRAYEQRVLALLDRHGGHLERRLATAARTTEIHLLAFPGQSSYEAFMLDPARAQARELLAGAQITQRTLAVADLSS